MLEGPVLFEFFMATPFLDDVKRIDQKVHELDSNKWCNQASKPVDEEISPEKDCRPERAEPYTAKRQRDQGCDDERIEDDRAQDRTGGRAEPHQVHRFDHRKRADEHGRNDGKVFGHIVCDAEGSEGSTGHEKLLSDLNDFDQFGWI